MGLTFVDLDLMIAMILAFYPQTLDWLIQKTAAYAQRACLLTFFLTLS